MTKLESYDTPPYDLLLLADPSKDIIDEYLKRGICYVCKTNEIVGVYVLLNTRPKTMELVNVGVREDMQRKGIGRILVQDAIRKAKESNMETLEIGTGNSSLGQLALYQKCGFRIVGVDKDFFIRHYDEEIIENGIKCVDMIRLSMDLN
ncbi:MAG: GNAT family N-acetyltransferase [Firmicutes bacterium]|nr:GNAT family N-acetyltransferase [Bacillota bacterium]